MKRRDFISQSSTALLAFSVPLSLNASANTSASAKNSAYAKNTMSAKTTLFLQALTKEWCDGMLAQQINAPNDAARHGALWCPSCKMIHGRCIDAVYPFLYMHQLTGEQKYLDAGINVFEWSKNVSHADGSFTVMADPTTWKGISVFGATSLAETIKHHGHLVSPEILQRWKNRLAQVGEYIYKNFDMTFTNINYGYSTVYTLLLIGEVLHNELYIQRSEALAAEMKNWLTAPHKLIFGEGKPSDKKSEKGLNAVDLGYNVEETLNAAVLYAVEKKDAELIQLFKKSLEGHLAFMLPDGGWDNSWGTRQYKWSYWGSRTTEGCQPAYTALAHLNSAFGRAAYQNIKLLQQCTSAGLLHGGPHYAVHGVKPCVHHTFTHAKALVGILNVNTNLDLLNTQAVLPREKSYKPKYFPEIDVWLMSQDGWKATVSGYDFVYKQHAQQVTGGALGMLYHEKAGVILSGSMAKYMLVEIYNQQKLNEHDYALTPRVECVKDGVWYTNLYDLTAKLHEEKASIKAQVQLVDENQKPMLNNHKGYELQYKVSSKNSFTITAKNLAQIDDQTVLTVPIISNNQEKIIKVNDKKIVIKKDNCQLEITSNAAFRLADNFPQRVFNLVPGFEALPLSVSVDKNDAVFVDIKIS